MKKERDLLFIVLILIAALVIFGSFGSGYMGGMMFFGPVFMILVLLLIIWLIVSLTQNR